MFLLVTFLHVTTTSAFLPLGSDPPSSCTIGNYECPSHYICSNSKCVCDRFYGFYGPDCEKLSVASYVYSIVYLLTWPIMASGFVYNVYLLRLLHEYGKLNCGVSVTLMLNTMATLIPCGMVLELPFTVFGVDKQMFMRQYLRAPFFMMLFFSSLSSSFKISESWIRLSLKSSRSKKSDHARYFYLHVRICGVAFVGLVIYCFFNNQVLEFLIATTPFFIALSYWYGGKLVVKTLRSMYRPGTKLSGVIVNALELAYAVEITANTIVVFSVLGVILALIGVTTFHSRTPYYPQQSHLPRWLQGQMAFVLVNNMDIIAKHVSLSPYILCCFYSP
jgi:hypothetical protein